MRVTVHTFLTADGVMQAPGGPGEDDDGGFPYGGWSAPYSDEGFGVAVDRWFRNADAFLLGRRTYEIFAGYWPRVPAGEMEPVSSMLNTLPKYVASTTLTELDWQNSTILADVVADVRQLKAQPGNELQVHGSGHLAQTLIANDLVDEYRLITFPVHLGIGKRLFGAGTAPGALRLVESSTTSAGAVITVYEPDGAVQLGSFDLAG